MNNKDKSVINHKDKLEQHYEEILDGVYDCPDRIILNGYLEIGSNPGGFRL